jgi:hypothetical protein
MSENFNSSPEERTRFNVVIGVLLALWAGIMLYMVLQNFSR